MSVALRRGKTTDAIFERAVRAFIYTTSSDPRTGRTIESTKPISVERAIELFDENRRVRMFKRSDGVFFFVIGSYWGTERVELEVA